MPPSQEYPLLAKVTGRGLENYGAVAKVILSDTLGPK